MSSDPGIRAFLFDFGGVMATFYRPCLFHRLEAELGLPRDTLAEILWNSPDWHLAEVGAITDVELWRRTGARLGLTTERDLLRLQQDLFAEVQAEPPMVDLVRQLRSRYRIGLLSNASDSLPRLLQERFLLDGLFDVVIVSAVVRLAKRDPAIFRLALERLGARAEVTVFVDDHLPNVEAAAALGIHAVHFTGYGALVGRLLEMGVLQEPVGQASAGAQ